MPGASAVRIANGCVIGLLVLSLGVILTATAFAQSGNVARGRLLYEQNCAVCHGDEAQGRVGARLARDFPGIRVDAFLQQAIANGIAGTTMPAWSQTVGGPLAGDQIDDIVAYLRSLGHSATAPAPATPPQIARQSASAAVSFPPGNPLRGATVYAQNCAVCHGEHGEGRTGATLARQWPALASNSSIEMAVASGVRGSTMPAWSVAYGGPLSDQEIADAAQFVRALESPSAYATPAVAANDDAGGAGELAAMLCGGLAAVGGLLALGIGLAGSRPPLGPRDGM